MPNWFAPLAIVALASAMPADAQKVQISFAVDPQAPTEREPIWVEVAFVNRWPRPVRVDLGAKRLANTTFTLTAADGRATFQAPADPSGFGRTPTVEISPNGAHREKILLNSRFPSLPAGRYGITVVFSGFVESDGSRERAEARYVASLEVLPRNAEKLARVCSGLALRATQVNDAADAIAAATALSYVDDPVALPFLASLLESRPAAAREMIEGLVRIGTAEAAGAIEGVLLTGDAPYDGFARAGLTKIMEQTKDLSLRTHIQGVLELKPRSPR